MYKTLKKAGISLLAVATMVLLFAPAVPAFAWGNHKAKDIVGMNVKARHGGVVGKVDNVDMSQNGRVLDVIIGLNGTDQEVTVPMSSIKVHRNHVTYKGTRQELYSMAPGNTQRGYYENSQRGYYPSDRGNSSGFNLNPINPDLPAMPNG